MSPKILFTLAEELKGYSQTKGLSFEDLKDRYNDLCRLREAVNKLQIVLNAEVGSLDYQMINFRDTDTYEDLMRLQSLEVTT